MSTRVPDDVLAPLPAALWQPLMWAYCEGTPMLVVLVLCVPGPVIVRTWSASLVAVVVFGLAWILFRALGAWDPRAFRVFKRAQRYRSRGTATLAARASWASPPVTFRYRRH